MDEKYFLSLSFGGREVGRKEATSPELRKLTDVTVVIGDPEREMTGDQCGWLQVHLVNFDSFWLYLKIHQDRLEERMVVGAKYQD